MKPILLLAALVASAMAQHWDIEKVDSAGWGPAVDMRWHPDGRLFLCYSDTSGVIRLASKGSVWSYEDLPQWRSVVSGTQGFDIDRRGRVGASYVGTDGHRWCALKTDTGWADVQTPFFGYPFFPSPTTLDTAGSLAITVQVGDEFKLARLLDTEWVSQALASGFSGWTNDFDCSALGSVGGVVWGVFRYTGTFPIERAYFCSLNRFQVRDSDASVVQIASLAGWIPATSGCVDARDSVHACYYYHPSMGPVGLYLDQAIIDTASVSVTAVKYDSLGRPQIAYTRRDSGLMYRCRTPEVWHVFDLHTGGVTALSLIIGEGAQPLIAYTTSDGVFLARGVDVVGQSEERRPPTAFGSRLTARVARGVLFLPGQPSTTVTTLFDMTGRRVAGLHSGANDVSGIAPGVYFVREAQAQAVRKVVISR